MMSQDRTIQLSIGLLWPFRSSGRGLWVVGSYVVKLNSIVKFHDPSPHHERHECGKLYPTSRGDAWTMLFDSDGPCLMGFQSALPVYVVLDYDAKV